MKDKERIKKIARQLVDLEKKCQVDKDNLNIYLRKMEKLTENLSLVELLQIDEYIVEKNLLTK